MDALYHDTPDPTTKICTKCHIEKPLTDFTRERKRKDGYKNICKSCCSLSYRAKAYGEIIVSHLVQLPLCFEAKVCNICHKEKPLTEFARNSSKDGHQNRCRACQNVYYRSSKEGKERANRQETLTPQIKGNKICRKCLEEKPLSEFFAHPGTPDKHAPQCKDCVSHRQYVVNREQSLERMRNHYHNNKETYQANMRKWREENQEHDREMHRKWVEEHPLRCRQLAKRSKLRRNQRLLNATIGTVDYDLVIEQYGFICHICGKDIVGFKELHMDHVIPIARGGAHSQNNLMPAHNVCNLRKADKLMEQLTPYDRRGPDA